MDEEKDDIREKLAKPAKLPSKPKEIKKIVEEETARLVEDQKEVSRRLGRVYRPFGPFKHRRK